jgi:hypothetical protein
MENDEKIHLKENQFSRFKESVKKFCTEYIEQMANYGIIFLTEDLPTLCEQNTDDTLEDTDDACFDERSIECTYKTADLLCALLIIQMRAVDFSQRVKVISEYEEALDEIDPGLKEFFFGVDFWIKVAASAIDSDSVINECIESIKNRTDKIQ